MRAEVVAVGTELLLGQIVDTNSSWIGEQLALAGIDCHFQIKVGDNLGRIVGSIRLGLERSEAVILCGGLGPTQDDITREAIAEVLGVRLVRDETVVERIRAMFASRNRPMAPSNLRQADVPEGASLIEQMPGTAPGLICPVGEKVIYAVPGVPHEMRTMMQGTILPDLRRRAGLPSVIRSRVLRTWGQTESGLADLLAERIRELDALGSPTLAFQASGIEGIKVRITAKAADEAGAQAILDEEEARLWPLIGAWVFGRDEQTMEAVVVERLRARGLTLGLVETVSGGLLASRLSATGGAADVLAGAFVAGRAEALERLLDLTGSSEVAETTVGAMAEGARRLTGADVGLASAGLLEADGATGRPAGLVLLGVAMPDGTLVREVRLPGDRTRIREYGVISLLDLLRRRLDEMA
ncbi:MAG TPA: CinA family nicotinamide mononucleotide deamidase-related protein [Geminicoccaceae bacterium]